MIKKVLIRILVFGDLYHVPVLLEFVFAAGLDRAVGDIVQHSGFGDSELLFEERFIVFTHFGLNVLGFVVVEDLLEWGAHSLVSLHFPVTFHEVDGFLAAQSLHLLLLPFVEDVDGLFNQFVDVHVQLLHREVVILQPHHFKRIPHFVRGKFFSDFIFETYNHGILSRF